MALIVSLVGGAYVMVLATASHEHTWLGWLTLLPLLVAIRVCRPLGAAASGTVWGLSFYAFSILSAGRLPEPSVGSLILLTLIPALYACLGAWLTRLIGFSPLVLGVGWMGVELAFEPLGLRNGLLAGAQGDGTLVLWIGKAFGYVLAAFLVAYVNACLLSALARIPVSVSSAFRLACGNDRGSAVVPQSNHLLIHLVLPTSMPRAPPAKQSESPRLGNFCKWFFGMDNVNAGGAAIGTGWRLVR